MIFDKYPYTNFHEMNDDWIIQTMRMIDSKLDEFVAANSLTYADPIAYDIGTVYPANTVVIYNDTAYVSKQAVGAGVLPTAGGDYWLEIFPFGEMIEQLSAASQEELEARIDDEMPALVNNWLNSHPAVTTTVNDNAISFRKLHYGLQDIMLDGYETVDENAQTIDNSEFTQGNIYWETGAEITSTGTCRTGFKTFPDCIIKFASLDGYQVTFYEYDSTETYLYKHYIVSNAALSAFVAKADHKYRVTITNLNGALAPADIPFGALMYQEYLPKYTKECAFLNDAIRRGYSYADDWERGNILTNGNMQNSTTKLRSSHFYDLGGKTITVSCNPAVAASTLKLNIFKYNSDGTFVSTVSFPNSTYYPRSITLDSGYVYKFTWADSTNATTYASDISVTYPNEIDYVPTLIGSEIHKVAYDLGIADGLIRAEKRNPFAFAPFDRGFVTFVWDDLRSDIDLVASIFAEYGFPIDIGAIPSKLSDTASGLQAASHGYTVGMTMLEVCEQVVADGGEIMAHDNTIVTSDNQFDYDFMYNHYVETRKQLERAGFNIRGFMRAGGGTVSHTPQIERWLIGNYEYSNDGVAVNYYQDRVTIDVDLDTLKARVLAAKTNHTWVRFMCHQLWPSENQGITETTLRALLDYIVEIGLDVVTYADVFDDYSSSQFLQS